MIKDGDAPTVSIEWDLDAGQRKELQGLWTDYFKVVRRLRKKGAVKDMDKDEKEKWRIWDRIIYLTRVALTDEDVVKEFTRLDHEYWDTKCTSRHHAAYVAMRAFNKKLPWGFYTEDMGGICDIAYEIAREVAPKNGA